MKKKTKAKTGPQPERVKIEGDWTQAIGRATWLARAERALADRNAVIEAVKASIDNCNHPDCIEDRKRTGFSCCAGGHIARKAIRRNAWKATPSLSPKRDRAC